MHPEGVQENDGSRHIQLTLSCSGTPFIEPTGDSDAELRGAWTLDILDQTNE